MSYNNIIRIPVRQAQSVNIRFSPLPRTGDFDPNSWPHEPLTRSSELIPGEWWEIDLASLNLRDGSYEYEFLVVRKDGSTVVAPDPYAEELTRYGGYRGIFHIRNGQRYRYSFSWEGEIADGIRLPNNNQIVIYELPMRWVDTPPEGYERQVGLGTFDKARFERLGYFQDFGINAIEMLPIQDSPDTLNWGYGTRFFFAPDLDIGSPVDLKLFIKECHRRGIRVILDLVMNHARKCPLEILAFDMFFLKNGYEEKDARGHGRNDWGGKLFRYREKRHGAYHARNFHFAIAEYWIREYHVDGFRIDEFKGIDNWDFIRDFRDHCWRVHQTAFPGRPFIVIAEDSWRRPEIVQDLGYGKTVDAMWDFDFRDELRRLVGNRIITSPDLSPRSERVHAMITGNRCWDDMGKRWRQHWVDGDQWVETGFTDMAQRVIYNTSHDVEGWREQRIFPYLVDEMKWSWRHWDHDQADKNLNLNALQQALDGVQVAFEQVFATFALMLTAPGIPMFLAGEEFGDLHDLDYSNWKKKMSDPIDWRRAEYPGHKELLARVKDLVKLRARHKALQRNEVKFFGLYKGFHPTFDDNGGMRVFAYCRTGGQPLGSPGQVIVIANCGVHDFPTFGIEWPWDRMTLTESGGINQPLPTILEYQAKLALRPYQVRIFAI